MSTAARDLVLAEGLTVAFPVGRRWWRPRVLRAVDDVTLTVREGEVLARLGAPTIRPAFNSFAP